MAAAAAPQLFRGVPLNHRLRLSNHHHRRLHVVSFITPLRRPTLNSATKSNHSTHRSDASVSSAASLAGSDEAVLALRVPERAKQEKKVEDRGSKRKWRVKMKEILRDVGPISLLAKEILHTDRYMDGQRLSAEHERVVVQKLLAYHPRYEDKIGCGIDSIIVDQHPTFKHTRCLFVVRTDGAWIDFSYQKCLRDYIRSKFPAHAEKFIRAHLKRGSGTNTAS
ncbi:DCL homolog, chloroplastic-like protein [Drosera capensis]